MNVPNKLECLLLASPCNIVSSNTLAYLGNAQVVKKMKNEVLWKCSHIFTISLSNEKPIDKFLFSRLKWNKNVA